MNQTTKDITTNQISDILNSTSNKQVNVYLRQTNKFGKKILISDKISVKKIMKIAESQFYIPKQFQHIYVGSHKYSYNDQMILLLVQGSIIHIHDMLKCNKKELRLTFQQIIDGKAFAKANQYLVKAGQKIGTFIERCLQNSQVIIVESGRKLDKQSTFQDYSIEDGANIYYIYKQIQINDEQFQKDFNKLFEQQQEGQKTTQSQVIREKNCQKKQEKPNKQIKRQLQHKESFQKTIQDQMQKTIEPQPNFKKKKTICLKAVKRNPEDSNYIWKRDASFSQTKNNNKKLIQALKGKKKVPNKLSTQNSATDQRMTIDAKIKLKQQFRKLFMSQNLGLKSRSKLNNYFREENYDLSQTQTNKINANHFEF